MNKSVNLYFDKSTAYQDKIKAIRDAGFDEFYLGIAETKGDLTLRDLIDYAKSLGLSCTMVHCAYGDNVGYFWQEGAEGDLVCEDYIQQIKQCAGLTSNFVVHLNNRTDEIQSEVGLVRLRKMLVVCEQCNINLCVENLCSETEIPYIFEHIKHDKLKICFDSGHQNFITPNLDVLGKFGEFVTVLHLHDNHGSSDEHSVCGQGTIDWSVVAQGLKKLPNIVLSAEVKYNGEIANQTYLSSVLNGLCMVEKLIKN